MIAELIVLAILVCSFGGLVIILLRKFPALNALPQNGSSGIREHHIILNIEKKLKGVLISFERQIFLQKFLSWIKVMTLKIETRVDHLLHRIRKKAQQVDKKLEKK